MPSLQALTLLVIINIIISLCTLSLLIITTEGFVSSAFAQALLGLGIMVSIIVVLYLFMSGGESPKHVTPCGGWKPHGWHPLHQQF